MIAYVLLILIGLKLDMLNGWYLALIIIGSICKILSYGITCVKAGRNLE